VCGANASSMQDFFLLEETQLFIGGQLFKTGCAFLTRPKP
jgi:hypothetical protein